MTNVNQKYQGLNIMLKWIKKLFHVHVYHHHHFAGANEYSQCRCKDRKVKALFKSVYTPIDRAWLDGGEPSEGADRIFIQEMNE